MELAPDPADLHAGASSPIRSAASFMLGLGLMEFPPPLSRRPVPIMFLDDRVEHGGHRRVAAVPRPGPVMIMGDQVESVRPCPVCRCNIVASSPQSPLSTRTCPHCDTAHHLDCWNLLGACSRYGCGASAGSSRTTVGAAPLTGAHPVAGRDLQFTASHALESDRTGRPPVTITSPVDWHVPTWMKTSLEIVGFILAHSFEAYITYLMLR